MYLYQNLNRYFICIIFVYIERRAKKGYQVEDENRSLVTALRNTFMPRLLDRDASVFAQLLRDLWPDVNIPLTFGDGRHSPDSEAGKSVGSLSKSGSKSASKRSQLDAPKNFRGTHVVLDCTFNVTAEFT